MPEGKGLRMETLSTILAQLDPETFPDTIKVYPRHKESCPNFGDQDFRRCSCWKYLYICQGGNDRRFSTRTRSWDKAEKLKHEIEDALDPIKREFRKLRGERDSKRVRTELCQTQT